MAHEPIDEKAVFNSARRIAATGERAAYLRQVCGHDPDALRRILDLLSVYEREKSFLESPPAGLDATIEDPIREAPGTVIGPYKLLEQIGEGGFGVVFLAEQTEPVRRKVALKVLKPGMDTRQVVARFEAERQALAIMDHPNIAKVHDGGATPTGRPYFVMELVKGMSITEFCDRNHLTPRQRLELFIPVCQAVQHAHHKGIIHRDLKPSNILVTMHDTTPVVKVIDFGIAKALGQELTDKTLVTGFAQMIGTPLYMSPEQAGQSGLDIDTRSDIYSLGVLLYELLTGTTPFTRGRFKQASYDEIRRIIREEDPPRPSTRLSTVEELPSIAANRGLEPRKLRGLVRGELDWIVMKALEKDRSRRYETANGFATDVHRYLAGDAVEACPPTFGYRMRKFVHRNRAAVAMAGVVAAALLLTIAGLAAGLVIIDQKHKTTQAALDELGRATDRERRRKGELHIALARSQWLSGEVEQAKQQLGECPEDLRDREWYSLHRSCCGELLRFRKDIDNVGVLYPRFSHDGELLAVVACVKQSRPDQIEVWDARSGQQRLSLHKPVAGPLTPAHHSFAFSHDGRRLISSFGPDLAGKYEIKTWDLQSGHELRSHNVGPKLGRGLWFSPGGEKFAVFSVAQARLVIFETESGRELCSIDIPAGFIVSPDIPIAWSPDSTILAALVSSSQKGQPEPAKVVLWGSTMGEVIRTVPLKPDRKLYQLDLAVIRGRHALLTRATYATVQADRMLGRGPRVEVTLSDSRSGQEIYCFTANALGFVAPSPDGHQLACVQQAAINVGGTGVTVKELATGRKIHEFRFYASHLSSLAYSPDGQRLAVSFSNGPVAIMDVSPIEMPSGR